MQPSPLETLLVVDEFPHPLNLDVVVRRSIRQRLHCPPIQLVEGRL